MLLSIWNIFVGGYDVTNQTVYENKTKYMLSANMDMRRNRFRTTADNSITEFGYPSSIITNQKDASLVIKRKINRANVPVN